MRPPTLLDLIGSPLLDHDSTLHLSLGDGYVHADCFDCQFYETGDDAEGGEFCAMEAAGMIGNVTPELARLFGWLQSPQQPDIWYPPVRCPWFADKSAPPIPFNDPRQLDAFADVSAEWQGASE